MGEQAEREDKTWFFLSHEGKVIFSVTMEWESGYTPPAELVELIELYGQGYRLKT